MLATSLRSLGRMAKTLEVFSVLVVIWGSSGIFMPVEMALNRVWGGQPRHFVFSRILAFVMTISGSALVFVSIALTSLARSYNRQWPTLATYGAKTIAFLLTCFVFFLIYRVIRIRRWARAWPAAPPSGRARGGRARSTSS